MSQAKVKQPCVLMKYFVFNASWGAKEGTEQEKLIYYYSEATPFATLEQKVSDIGLAEAVINFGKQFGDTTEALCGTRQRFVFYNLTGDFWSSMCVSEPYTVLKSNDDNTNYAEYHDNEMTDEFFKLKLQNVYQYFTLLNGPIDQLCIKFNDDRTGFRSVCEKFFDNYIPHIDLMPFNLIELFSTVQYLPLTNAAFMDVQSLLHCMQACDDRIHSYIFLYNDQLVSSSLSLHDTQVIFNYLTNVVIPEAVKDEINDILSKVRWLLIDLKVYLTDTKSFKSLCLFRSINSSTIGLLLDEFDQNILNKCEAWLAQRLVALTNNISETLTQLVKNSDLKNSNDISVRDIKFIYVNKSNLAIRGNTNCRKFVDSDFTRLIIDVDTDFSKLTNDSEDFELVGKNTNDAWLVTLCSDYRKLFTILNHKNANLMEATDMVDALRHKHLKNMFFGLKATASN